MSDRSLAQPAHPEPEDSGKNNDLEHIGEIAARAMLSTARLSLCAACSGRFRCRVLHPVPEDHLTFFEGQLLCRECARKHGVT